MNPSPDRLPLFDANDFQAVHWSAVGDPQASDREIMQWARTRGFVVFTHDLDFGILLAHTRSGGPSVIQVRTQDVSPAHLGHFVLHALRLHGQVLENGALLTITESQSRVRILPI